MKKNVIKNESVTVKKDIKTKSYRKMRSRKKKNERAKKGWRKMRWTPKEKGDGETLKGPRKKGDEA